MNKRLHHSFRGLLLSCLLLALMPLIVHGQGRDGSDSIDRSFGAGMSSVALSFIENRGQIVDAAGERRPDILYSAGVGPVRMYLRRGAISYVFSKIDGDSAALDPMRPLRLGSGLDSRRGVRMPSDSSGRITSYRMDVELVGSNPDAIVTSEDQIGYHTNYYLAHCPDGITNVGSYRRVVYHEIYPKIDLVFHSDSKGIKYDFVVHPGGDVKNIRLRYIGADDLSVTDDGGLRSRNELGVLSEGKPVSYQAGGAVRCEYSITGKEVVFVAGAYDRGSDLVIDPWLLWATYVGGSGLDIAGVTFVGGWLPVGQVATDADGNVIVTGGTGSADFPIVAGTPFQSALNGGFDGYLLKLGGGGQPLWGTFIGGSNGELVGSVVCDRATGGIDLCGYTESLDFPITPGAMQGVYGGGHDIFIAQFDASGARRWATYFGGDSVDAAVDIAVDRWGNIGVTGVMWGASPMLPDPFPPPSPLAQHMHTEFILRMTSAGVRSWATMYGGTGVDACASIAFDRSGNIVIAGVTMESGGPLTLPFTAGTFQPATGGDWDGFVSKFDSSGHCLWSTFVGGSDEEAVLGVACDSADDIVICGVTQSTNFPVTPSGFQTTYGGDPGDGFIMKLTGNGGRVWGTYYGGAMNPSGTGDAAMNVCLAANNDILVVGFTQSTDFPVTADAFQSTLNNQCAAFLLRFTTAGVRRWGSYYGSSAPGSTEVGQDLAIDDSGDVYIAGDTRLSPTSLPGASLGFQPASGGGYNDAFLAKFTGFCSLSPPPIPPINLCGDALSTTIHGPDGFRGYRWSPGDATTQDLTVTVPGTYTLTVLGRDGCLGTASVEVRRAPRPKPDIIPFPSLDLCDGDSVKLDATTRGVISYKWSTGDTTASIWTKRAGQYTLRVIDTNGCSDTAFPVTVRVFPRPDKPVLPPGPIRICPDSVLVLSAGGSFTSYLWSTGAKSQSIKVTSPGRYFVTGYNEFGCGRSSDTVQVLFNARPIPKIVVHGKLVACQGDSVDLEVTGGVFRSIKWSTGQQTSAISVWKPGVYSVQVWSLEGCRGGPDTATVTILPGPAGSIGGPEEVCVNATVTYRTTEIFGLTYQWTLSGDGAIVGSSNGSSVTVKWGSTGSGVLTLVVTDPRTGCTVTITRNVTIGTQLKSVITAGGPTTFCDGDSLVLDGGYGMKSYKWSNGDSSEYIIVRESGRYTVSVEDSGGCKGTSNPIEVTVVPRPLPEISGARKLCLNGTASYSAADVVGHEYTWFVAGGVILSGQGSSAITVQWGSGPAGTVDLSEASGQGLCAGRAKQLSVEIGSELEPVITAGGPTSFCLGDSVVLDAGAGYDGYLWSDGQTTRTITVRGSGSYSVTVSDAGGCSGTSPAVSTVVSPPAEPVIRLLGPATFCLGDSVVLDAGSDFAGYRWSNGATTQLLVVRTAGSYSVVVTTAGGCSAGSLPVEIVVEDRPTPVIAGAVKVCQGSTTSYSTVGGAGDAYAWSSGGGTIISGQGTSRIVVQWGSGPVGVLDLVETNASGRCQTVAQRYEVKIGSELEPVITPGGHLDLCQGESIELDAGEGYARYLWSSGDTTRRIVVGTSGRYVVRVWDAGGCNGSSQAVEVEVHALPVPVISASGPLVIIAGESVVLDAGSGYASYQWTTGERTRTISVTSGGEYGVTVVDGFGCRGTSAMVSVEVRAPGSLRGGATVELPAITGVPGERVRIPLTLRESHDLPGVDLEYSARLRFRASLLAPSGSTPGGRIDGADRVLDLHGTLPSGVVSGPLADLEFLVLLGDTEHTALHLESFAWSDTTIATALSDGTFTLQGLCIAGPTRLVGSAGHFALKAIRPNPASGRAEIEYEVNENGRLHLDVVDLLGRRVAMIVDADQLPGRYSTTIDAGGLPSGSYMVMLWSATQRASIAMQVQQ